MTQKQKKTTSPRLREWAHPTCSINGFGHLENGRTYDLNRLPDDVTQHPAWRAPTPTKESDRE